MGPQDSRETPEQQARALLNQRSSGANGVLAYVVAGPSEGPKHLLFAVMETNRVGVTVVGIPGGTQDILAALEGESPIRFELGKQKAARNVLAALGLELPNYLARGALDHFVVTKLIAAGFDTTLETPLEAAVRETAEEHGLKVTKDNQVSAPVEFRASIVAKRSIEDAENKLDHALFALDDVKGLDDVGRIHESLRSEVKLSEQVVFAARLRDFEGVVVEQRDRIESGKVRGREGMPYYENGTYMTAAEVRQQLLSALPEEREQQKAGNALARMDVVATFGRLQVLERIEAHLVQTLVDEGLNVMATGPGVDALTPYNQRPVIEERFRPTPGIEIS